MIVFFWGPTSIMAVSMDPLGSIYRITRRTRICIRCLRMLSAVQFVVGEGGGGYGKNRPSTNKYVQPLLGHP